jgi:hypothetical protein
MPAEPAAPLEVVPPLPPFELPVPDPPALPDAPPEPKPASLVLQPTAPTTAKDKLPITNAKRIIFWTSY